MIPLDNMRLPVVVDPLTNFVNRQSGPATNDSNLSQKERVRRMFSRNGNLHETHIFLIAKNLS